MIGRLSGTLVEKNPPQILLDVQGVAYEVDVPMSTFYNLPNLGERVTLFTHLVVREDAHLLFGFGSENERRGVPAAHQDQRHRRAHRAVGAFRPIGGRARPGRHHAGSGATHADSRASARKPRSACCWNSRTSSAPTRRPPSAFTAPRRSTADVLHALVALGYSDKEAVHAVKQLPEGVAVGDGIRQALKVLSKA